MWPPESFLAASRSPIWKSRRGQSDAANGGRPVTLALVAPIGGLCTGAADWHLGYKALRIKLRGGVGCQVPEVNTRKGSRSEKPMCAAPVASLSSTLCVHKVTSFYVPRVLRRYATSECALSSSVPARFRESGRPGDPIWRKSVRAARILVLPGAKEAAHFAASNRRYTRNPNMSFRG